MAQEQQARRILEECHRNKHPVLISGSNLPITFQTHLLSVEGDRLVLENRIMPRYIARFVKSPSFALQAGMARFETDSVGSDGEHIIFTLKENSLIEETRQAERFTFTADERVVTEILNPFDGETRLSKSVMDMSATGLSLRTPFDSRLFRPGTHLPHLKVMIDGEPYLESGGRVVYTRKLMDLKGQLRTQVGIKFENN